MTAEERMLGELTRSLRGRTPREVTAELLRFGVIDTRRLEAYLIRRDVALRTARGEGKCRAMDEVACDRCCSYEKVRRIVYEK